MSAIISHSEKCRKVSQLSHGADPASRLRFRVMRYEKLSCKQIPSWPAIVVCFTFLLFAVAAFGQARITAKAGTTEIYWPTDGWRSTSPEAQGMDSVQLAEALNYVANHKVPIHNLMIIRNGYVVLDASFYPFQAGQLHDGASMTKSITSTLIGIAIGQHKLTGLDQPVVSLLSPPHHCPPRPGKREDYNWQLAGYDVRFGLSFRRGRNHAKRNGAE